MLCITLIFKAPGLAKSFAEYLKLVESTNSKIDKLVQAKFDGALETLRSAIICTNPEVQSGLLYNAISSFHEACRHEHNQRLAWSYIGAALCFFYLGEEEACKNELRKLSKKEFVQLPVRWTMGFAKGFLGDSVYAFMNGFLGTHIVVNDINSAYSLRDSAKICLQEFDSFHYEIDQVD